MIASYALPALTESQKDREDKPVIYATSEPEPEIVEVAEKVVDVVTYVVGERVKFGDYGITVVDVTAVIKDEVRHIDILIEVENKGKEPIRVDSSYFKLLDTNDREFEPSDSFSFEGDPVFMYDSINPGLKLTKKVKFEVPTDVTSATLSMRDNMFDFGAEYTLINLGDFK
ncbi:DUF4352 domain-containing protein [Paenibacillus sp. DS2015]|uniref:DUF4352 domain-containing protein n=1 Tax=Paenibacillus sp. DS2015 TaxID=3373917 RepID=UPI003D1FED3E